MTLRPYQTKLVTEVRQAWAAGARNVLMRADTGAGKCLGRGTRVLMFDGSVRAVETICAGEQLMGPDSRPRTVLSVCSGVEPLYRVVPVKGESYVVNESHILSLKSTKKVNDPKYPCDILPEITNICVREYLTKPARWKHLWKGWRTGVEFPASALPVELPPYILGLWLGDGHSRCAALTVADEELAEAWRAHAFALGLPVRIENAGGKAKTYHISSGTSKGSRERNTFLKALQEQKVINNKHIPHVYKTGDREQRLELLAGILDTDGHLGQGGYDFISKSFAFAEDVAFVARSLGLAATLAACFKSAHKEHTGAYYRVHISGATDEIPCRLPRKQALPRRQKKDVLKTGISLTPLGPGEYFGFEIDGDRLFLLGDFTVTHNTVMISEVINNHPGASVAIAHRNELVSQLSLALARNGVVHDLIAARNTCREIAAEHVELFGRPYYQPGARCRVASIDTLVRADGLQSWGSQVTLWITDEGHHVVEDNKWHKGLQLFTNPHVLGLLPTATPSRADGKGLGRPALGGSGVADVMVEGPSMRWLIEQGYLTDYEVVCPESDLAAILQSMPVGASGDWSPKKLREAAKRSHIVGDVVSTYQRWAAGKLGVTFAPDVDTAKEITAAYLTAGVRAATLTGDTQSGVRRNMLRRFERRELDVIVAVDIISEGFDLPAIEVINMGRKTESLAMYRQMFGRELRPVYAPGHDLETQAGRLAAIAASSKPLALLIDQVGNWARHGAPDRPIPWSLADRERGSRGKSDAIPSRVCTACIRPYERFLDACPWCGEPVPEPTARTSPAVVEGDLIKLDAATLAQMRAEVIDVDQTREAILQNLAARNVPPAYISAQANKVEETLEAQRALRATMGRYGGVHHAGGLSDAEIQKRFWFEFGTDVLTAQALGKQDAHELAQRIEEKLR